jgi:hypothetical protein
MPRTRIHRLASSIQRSNERRMGISPRFISATATPTSMVSIGQQQLSASVGPSVTSYGNYATKSYMVPTKQRPIRSNAGMPSKNLTAIYEMRDQLIPRDRDILKSSYEEHAKKSTNQIKNWLHTYKQTILQSVKVATNHAITGVRRAITSYFTSVNNA